MASIHGTVGPDNLVGTAVEDEIYGYGGDDNLQGVGGNDRLFGADGNDSLLGGDGDDQLIGGVGSDTLNGGAGVDVGSYVDSAAAVSISLDSVVNINSFRGGDAQGDSATGIEGFIGSAFNDFLSIRQAAGSAILSGGDGDDGLSVAGGAFARIYGGAGDDSITADRGGEYLDGGAGVDAIGYGGVEEFSTVAVTIDLTAGIARTSDGYSAAIRNFENIYDGYGNDRLIGDSRSNFISASLGDDVIYGLGGDDRILAGSSPRPGASVLVGGAGADELRSFSGADTAAYHTSSAGVTVDLSLGQGFGGEAEGDTLFGIPHVTGSAYADILIGNGSDNQLQGGGGADQMSGGQGVDTLAGGSSADTFVYKAMSDSAVSIFGRDTITDFSHAQGDKIDLRPIDADGNSANGNTAFTFVAGGGFTGAGHEVSVLLGNGVYVVVADSNGDKVADMAINVHSATALVAGDFML